MSGLGGIKVADALAAGAMAPSGNVEREVVRDLFVVFEVDEDDDTARLTGLPVTLDEAIKEADEVTTGAGTAHLGRIRFVVPVAYLAEAVGVELVDEDTSEREGGAPEGEGTQG